MTCTRDGCTLEARPTFCSRRCASLHNGQLRKGTGFYQRIGALGRAGKHAKGRSPIARPTEISLMAQGRYREAAQAIYDRAYSSGWVAGRRGHRQLQVKA